MTHVDPAHLDHQFAGLVFAEQGVQRSNLGLQVVEDLTLPALPLLSLFFPSIGFSFLGSLGIDGCLNQSPALKYLVVWVNLTLECSDIGVQVLGCLLEVLGVLPVKCGRVEVRRLVHRVRQDNLVVELTGAVVVFLAPQGDGKAQFSGDVSRLLGRYSRKGTFPKGVVSRVYGEVSKVQVRRYIARVQLYSCFKLSDGRLLVAHD